jgi:hypothetical protein
MDTYATPSAPRDHLAAQTRAEIVEYVPVCRTEYKLLAHMRLERPDASFKELAAALGYSTSAIRVWVRDPAYQTFENWLLHKQISALPPAIRNIREAVEEKFNDFAGYMQERLLDILDTSEDPKIQVQVAHDWLDRAGFSPVKKQMSGVMSLTLTPEVLAELRRREQEADIPVVPSEP